MRFFSKSLAVLTFVTVVGMVLSLPAAHAAEKGAELPELEWPFDGVFGTYDRASLQRGFQIYSQVCMACHSMEFVSYRDLAALGYSEEEIKAIAAQYTVMDGPNDEGEMFERPALPSDRFVSPYPNPQAARYVNNGALPPDMSLLTKARHGGADYIYGILTGYEEAPHDKELLEGQYWNKYMPGHIIAMAPPLSPGMVTFEDGTAETVEQYAYDMAQFLTWAADPHMEKRKQTGFKVFLYLLVFAGVMYAVKRKLWAKLH